MCNSSCIEFVRSSLKTSHVEGRRVLEVGSLDVNGTARPLALTHSPASYLGVDIVPGPGVDAICNVADLVTRFGPASFDVVISTEVLEHVLEWRAAVSNLKGVLAPDGILILTTRSKGFRYHGHPYDYWRYEIGDFRKIFSDLQIERLQSDPEAPGVFLKARRTHGGPPPPDLDAVLLFSILRGERCVSPGRFDGFWMRQRWSVFLFLKRLLPQSVKDGLKRAARALAPHARRASL